MRKITIGTRGSRLSLAQTDMVKKEILSFYPETEIVIKIISTTGDRNFAPIPLDTVGKGWFTKELDKALIEKTIDLAVHSLKDIPEILPEELCITAIPKREDARDVLVSKEMLSLDKLDAHAVIGTDSTRRQSQILQKR